MLDISFFRLSCMCLVSFVAAALVDSFLVSRQHVFCELW